MLSKEYKCDTYDTIFKANRRQNIVSYLRNTPIQKDEDHILEKPGDVIIANYASVTIIYNERKHIRTERH